MPSKRDFAAEVAALQSSRTQGPERAYELRDLNEAWARALLGLPSRANLVARARSAIESGLESGLAREAAERLKAAEKQQSQIASWATSGAEGLASMKPVRLLQLAQAWLLAANAAETRDLQRAARLATELRRAPNGLDRPSEIHLVALERRLAEFSSARQKPPERGRE